MALVRAIEVAATSIDRPGSMEATRFNAAERQELLALVETVSLEELAAARELLHPDAVVTHRPGVVPLWTGVDAPFRQELVERVEARLAGGPQLAPPASVSPRPANARSPSYAVLMVDATGLYVGGTPRQRANQQEAMRRVLMHANARGVPVFEIIMPELFETNSRLAELRRPDNWVQIEKSSFGAFETTNLAQELARRGITNVVVMGQFQDGCVLLTAQSAAAHGIQIETSPLLLQGEPGTRLHTWYRTHALLRDTVPFFRH